MKDQTDCQNELPTLLYIGDVPVENSYHGSVQLYRLLEEYPSDKLLIVEGDLVVSQPKRRLKGVNYKHLKVGRQRCLNTRFHSYLRSWLLITAKSRTRGIPKLLGDFQPEAVLTVTHNYSWLTAAQWAKQNNLPLHLILHDDWIPTAPMLEVTRKWLEKQFERVYYQANSRLCVSPYMMEKYERQYGVSGTVMYPCRSKDVATPAEPVTRTGKRNFCFTVVYAGTLNTSGYFPLRTIAECLENLNGKLVIYGSLTKEEAIKKGLNRSNICVNGFLPAEQFIERIRQEADVLFVPMHFDNKKKKQMQTSFPSKLTDYTATGLPLLIYGPPCCSAVRWAQENPGVAEVVASENSDELGQALERLKVPQYRDRLARVAIERGNQLFAHTIAREQFLTCLTREPNQI